MAYLKSTASGSTGSGSSGSAPSVSASSGSASSGSAPSGSAPSSTAPRSSASSSSASANPPTLNSVPSSTTPTRSTSPSSSKALPLDARARNPSANNDPEEPPSKEPRLDRVQDPPLSSPSAAPRGKTSVKEQPRTQENVHISDPHLPPDAETDSPLDDGAQEPSVDHPQDEEAAAPPPSNEEVHQKYLESIRVLQAELQLKAQSMSTEDEASESEVESDKEAVSESGESSGTDSGEESEIEILPPEPMVCWIPLIRVTSIARYLKVIAMDAFRAVAKDEGVSSKEHYPHLPHDMTMRWARRDQSNDTQYRLREALNDIQDDNMRLYVDDCGALSFQKEVRQVVEMTNPSYVSLSDAVAYIGMLSGGLMGNIALCTANIVRVFRASLAIALTYHRERTLQQVLQFADARDIIVVRCILSKRVNLAEITRVRAELLFQRVDNLLRV